MIPQINLADIYRTFHTNTAKYTFFSVAHRTFPKVDHIIGQKASLSKYRKIETASCILSDHSEMKLKISNKKTTNTWIVNNWVTEEIRKEVSFRVK